MIFGDEVGTSLVRGPYCQRGVVCDADALLHCNSTDEEDAWVCLKPNLGGARFNLLRVEFWTPGEGNVFKKGSESGPPWKSKVVFARGSSFGPSIVANLLCLFQVEADLTSNIGLPKKTVIPARVAIKGAGDFPQRETNHGNGGVRASNDHAT